MNPWTLQFSDKSLERDFFKQVIPGLLKYFYCLTVTLMALSISFSTYLFIIGNQVRGILFGTLFVTFTLTQILIKKYNKLINIGFFVYNVVLFLAQVLYLVSPSYLGNSQEAYILGICEAYLQVAFLMGTNFGYKIVILVCVLLEKLILSVIVAGFFEVQIMIVFAVFFTAVAAYWTDRTRRDFFLSQYANSQFNEIIDREVKSNIIMCSIDQENVKIRFQKANQFAKQNLKICDDFLLTSYLRQIKMKDITLEEWLFNNYFTGLLTNTIIQTKDAEIRIRIFDKLKHQIILFIDNHEFLTRQLKTTKANLSRIETQHLRYIAYTANSMEKISCLTYKLIHKNSQAVQQQLSTILVLNTNVIYNHLYMNRSPKLTLIQNFNLLIFLRQFIQICNVFARSCQSSVRLYYPTSCDIMICSNIKFLSHIVLNQIRNALYITKKCPITLKITLPNNQKNSTCEFELIVPQVIKRKENNQQRNKVSQKLLKFIGPTDQIDNVMTLNQAKIKFVIYTDLRQVIESLK